VTRIDEDDQKSLGKKRLPFLLFTTLLYFYKLTFLTMDEFTNFILILDVPKLVWLVTIIKTFSTAFPSIAVSKAKKLFAHPI